MPYALRTLSDGRPSWRAVSPDTPLAAGETLHQEIAPDVELLSLKHEAADTIQRAAASEANAAMLLPAVDRERRLTEIRTKRDDLRAKALNARSPEELEAIRWT